MHVYLSYALTQKTTARSVRRALSGHGVEVWPRGDSGRQSDRIAAIREAAAFVAVLSEDFLRSRVTTEELALAQQASRPVPVAGLVERTEEKSKAMEALDGFSESAVFPLADDGIKRLIELPFIPNTKPFDQNTAPAIAVDADASMAFGAKSKTELGREVFMSYASEDADDAAEIRKVLDKGGIKYWDYKATRRAFGVNIRHQIQQGIDEAQVCVVVQSENYDDSMICQQEFAFAVDIRRRPIVPVRFRHKRETLADAGLHYVDCIEDSQQGLGQLVEAVRTSLPRQ